MPPLTQPLIDLIQSAKLAIDAVPRDTPRRQATDHTVSAATLASDGRVFTGINVPHWSGGPCAENVMFANAVSAG